MLAIGTKVNHTGHGAGTIVAYNGAKRNEYIEQNLGSPEVAAASMCGLMNAIIASFYDGDRYPYVIQFDSGYKDVYAASDVTEVA